MIKESNILRYIIRGKRHIEGWHVLSINMEKGLTAEVFKRTFLFLQDTYKTAQYTDIF